MVPSPDRTDMGVAGAIDPHVQPRRPDGGLGEEVVEAGDRAGRAHPRGVVAIGEATPTVADQQGGVVLVVGREDVVVAVVVDVGDAEVEEARDAGRDPPGRQPQLARRGLGRLRWLSRNPAEGDR